MPNTNAKRRFIPRAIQTIGVGALVFAAVNALDLYLASRVNDTLVADTEAEVVDATEVLDPK